MGKKSNNGMNNSAKLLSALFKDPTKSSNKENLLFQYIIYNMLVSLGKPIDIYFINDKMNGIEDKYADSLHLYVKPGTENKNYVFPGSYGTEPKNDTSAGKIAIGEPPTVEKGKDYILRAVSFLFLKQYYFLNTPTVYYYENPSPPPLMYKQKQLSTTFPAVDVRKGIYNAIALSLSLGAGISSGREKEYYDKWLAAGPYIEVRKNNHFKILKNIVSGDVPDKFILNNQLKRSLTYPSDTGFSQTNPPFNGDAELLSFWKVYDFKNLDNYNKLSNEFILALILKKYLDKNSPVPFIEALLYKDRRLEKAPPEKQFPILIENLCMYGMEENVPISVSSDKIYFYPLAIMDLFLEFPIEIVDNNFHSARTFFGVFDENSFSPELLKAYFKLRPAIKEAANKANKKTGLSPLYSGYDNITRMCDGIWEYLYKNR
jgi:hypothetical protein